MTKSIPTPDLAGSKHMVLNAFPNQQTDNKSPYDGDRNISRRKRCMNNELSIVLPVKETRKVIR